LLSPARATPVPSIDYPLLPPSSSSSSSSVDGLTAYLKGLCGVNPQDLLAGASKAARLQATMAGSAAAQGTQTLLLGAPAVLPLLPSSAWPHALRVHLLNEAGVSTIVTAPSSATTIREIGQYYAHKNNCNLSVTAAAGTGGAGGTTAPWSLATSLFVFSFHGVMVTSDKATLASIGYGGGGNTAGGAASASSSAAAGGGGGEMDVLHVRLDFERLYRSLREEMGREVRLATAQALQAEQARDQEEKRWKDKQEELERAEAAMRRAAAEVDRLSSEKSSNQSSIDAAKKALEEQREELTRLARAKQAAEGSDADRIEVKRHEKLRASLAKELASLQAEVSELAAKEAKVAAERSSLARDIAALEQRQTNMEDEMASLAYLAPVESFASPAEAAAAAARSAPPGFQPLATLTSQLERLERAQVEFVAAQKKIHFIVQEITHKKAEIHALNKKVALAVSVGATPAGAAASANGTTFMPAQQQALVEEAQADASTSPQPPLHPHAASASAGTPTGSHASTPLSSASKSLGGGASSSAAQQQQQQSSSSQDLLPSLPLLRHRAALLEKETRELVRWKSIAKHLEQEAKESARWKALGKAAQQRERALEQAAAEIGGGAAHWRQRARAFEKEVRELRAWKRAVDASTSGLGMPPSSPQGDFYIAANPTPLSNISYDGDASNVDGGGGANGGSGIGDGTVPLGADDAADGDDDSVEPIEPHPRHVTISEEEERLFAQKQANAAALAAANGGMLVDENADPVLAAQQRISAELLAAEAEEERLVQSMKLNSSSHHHATGPSSAASTPSNASSPASGPSLASSPRGPIPHGGGGTTTTTSNRSRRASTAGTLSAAAASAAAGSSSAAAAAIAASADHRDTATEDEELFRLGEALVRRNQHLQQHRMMVRYQQQQLALQAAQMQRDMEMQMQHQQHQQHQHQHQSMQHVQQDHSSMHNYANKTGVLQASAPVFTPRFQTDAPAVLPLQSNAPVVGMAPGGLGGLSSHYTKIGGGGSGSGITSPFGSSLHTSPSLSPSPPAASPLAATSTTWSSSSHHSHSHALGHGHGHGHGRLGHAQGSLEALPALDALDPAAFWLPHRRADSGSNTVGSSILDSTVSAGGPPPGLGGNTSTAGGLRNRSFSQPPSMLPPPHHQSGLHHHLSSLSPSHATHGGALSLSPTHGPIGSGAQGSNNVSMPFTAFHRSANLTIIDDDSDLGGGGSSAAAAAAAGVAGLVSPGGPGSSSGTAVSDGASPLNLGVGVGVGVGPVGSGMAGSLFGGTSGHGQLPAFFSLSQQQSSFGHQPERER
jgi:hypothetical protein